MISVRRHLTRTLLGTALILGGTGASVMYFAARDAAVDQFDFALRAKALAISTLTTPGLNGVRVTFTDHFMRGFDDRNPQDYFEIWSPSGLPLARSESLGHADLPRPKGFSEEPDTWSQRLPSGHPGRAIAFSFFPKTPGSKQADSPVYIMVASDSSELDEDLWQLVAIAAASGVVLLGVTAWLIPRVLRKGLEPLERLGDRAAAIDSDTLDTRFSVSELPEELQPIAGRLNDLLLRIEQSFERERRFSADLAHELRTPLAELRSLVECSQKWPETKGPGDDGEILAITSQIETIVSHLLALARNDRGQIPVKSGPVSLSDVVGERWSRLAERAASRGLRTELKLEEAVGEADPALLQSIMDNVLENAVDYSSVPGEIRITVLKEAAGAVLRVENTCDNLSREDVARLFDRFWRKEASRTGGQHVGLGLPLARAFAEAMGWRLTAQIDTPGVLTLMLFQSPGVSMKRVP